MAASAKEILKVAPGFQVESVSTAAHLSFVSSADQFVLLIWRFVCLNLSS